MWTIQSGTRQCGQSGRPFVVSSAERPWPFSGMLRLFRFRRKRPAAWPPQIERSGVCGTCGDYRYLIFALAGPSGMKECRWPLQCNNVVLETSRLLLHIWSVARVRPTSAQAGGRSSPLTRPFRNGEFDVASSSSSIRRYAEGAPQRGLHRAHERRRCRRVDGASQAGLVAVCALVMDWQRAA